MDSALLFQVFVFLAAVCLVVPLVSRFRLGSVLGYLAAGVLIGPFGFGFIHEAQHILHFAEFGVVMMLFLIGLELEPFVLWRRRRMIVGLGGLQVIVTTALFTWIGMLLDYPLSVSLAVGMALSLSSTALVLQMLEEKNLMQTNIGEVSFSVLIFQDILVIPMLVLLPLLATGAALGLPSHGAGALLDTLPDWAQALATAGVILLVILGGRYGAHHLFRNVARSNLREVFTATSLALVVGTTLLMQLVGISPALGAFIAGMMLANSEYRRTIETDIEPFKGLLLGLFFVSVGMGVDFALLALKPVAIFLSVATLVILKGLVLYVLARAFGFAIHDRFGLAFALSQGGEFAFVLFKLTGGLGILPPELGHFLTLVVALSMVTTPLLMFVYLRLVVPRFLCVLPPRAYDVVDKHQPVILAGFGTFGQVVGRFLLTQGVEATVLENDPEQIDLIRKFGFKGFFGDASRLDVLRQAGAGKAKLLIVAVDDADVALEIVRMARQEFPQLTVFARARNRRHAYELHKEGVAYFKREMFDSSLTMAQHILVALGRDAAEIARKAELFRAHDEATLEQSFEFFENEPELVNFARLRREEMEQLLQSDLGAVKPPAG
jgi:glutathione-regulated potassium-efflux system ancillary protein KefC